MLAMHMANELLTPGVAVVLFAVAAVAVAAAARAARRDEDPAMVPLMGVMGAFIFAAQMINFSLPLLPGTSGHLGGGLLLAILLGPHAATVVMAAILIIQCLIFQDGGLLALGANIINMGVLPCYVGYGMYRAILGRDGWLSPVRLYVATFAAAVIAVNVGAVLVPLQAAVAGVITVPLKVFLGTMVGVHLIIGSIEGLITFAVVAYLNEVRPDAIRGIRMPIGIRPRLSVPAVVTSLAIVAVLLGALVSHMASGNPDGLEWTYAERPDQPTFEPMVQPPPETGLIARADAWLERVALLPDYGGDSALMLTVSGVGGIAATLAVTVLLARLIRRRHKSAEAGQADAS